MRFYIFLFLLVLSCAILLMPPALTLGSTTLYRPVIRLGSFSRDLNFKLGLDLQGGSHLTYAIDTSQIESSAVESAIAAVRSNIERRINLLGVSESIVQTSQVGGEHRLIVELPGVTDANLALKTIGSTAKLDFREVEIASAEAEPQFSPTDLTGSDLKSATVQFGQGSGSSLGQPVVAIQFTPVGATKFSAITSKIVGKPLAIFLDDQLITAPIVEQAITDGQAIISGDFTVEAAQSLSIQLTAGALPLPITVIGQKNIGATLGSESVVKSLFAGVIGIVLVWLFMLLNYGKNGLLANIALTLYVLLSLSVFKLLPVTLTLSGIAGFILSVGMAVDANVLIFERIREELRWGRPPRAAIELGFLRAWSSVRDSNISSLITGGILFWFGSGSVRGFALTLCLGILISLFTSITVTKNLIKS
jgi:preprotein translocase subunit SecD